MAKHLAIVLKGQTLEDSDGRQEVVQPNLVGVCGQQRLLEPVMEAQSAPEYLADRAAPHGHEAHRILELPRSNRFYRVMITHSIESIQAFLHPFLLTRWYARKAPIQ